jgi:hypothetical protein
LDRIVQQEGSENFITKLHKGKLGIIPWGVIESPSFYKLFNKLKIRFMKQPITHKHAGAFIVTLKTLMAKLKVGIIHISVEICIDLLEANDWGALDRRSHRNLILLDSKILSDNLAAQRAQYLLSILPQALSCGYSDIYSKEKLKV